MRYKIAIVEDDDLIRNMIMLNLENIGYKVKCFSSAESMMRETKKEFYDLIILDIMLPGISGERMLKDIRSKGDDTPILMLTVKSDMPTRIKSLEGGADDYVVKPFNMEELIARIKVLIRRTHGKRRIPSHEILVINSHKIDISTRVCQSNIGDVVFSEKELNLLLFLFKHSDETISRADILEEVWGMNVTPTPRTIDNFIFKFRKLFEDNPQKPKHFITIRNKGYRFIK
jgi:two-component system alkaline phosphatase synthesis response regulator PhoP